MPTRRRATRNLALPGSVRELTAADREMLGAQHGAIEQFLDRVSLPIYSTTREVQRPVGTGTLFRVHDGLYLVTAAHVVEECRPGTIAVPLDRRFRAVTTLGPHRTIRGARAEHDVALIRLDDPKILEQLPQSWTVLEGKNLGAPLSSGPFVVHGYQAPAHPSPAGFTRPGPRLMYMGARYTGPVSRDADPLDREYDLLVDLDSESVDFRTLRGMRTPRFHGVSGASIWEMIPADPRRVWTAEAQLRLVAIQSGACHFRYLRAKRWHMLWSAFREFDSRGGHAVRTAITRSLTTRKRIAAARTGSPPSKRKPDRR